MTTTPQADSLREAKEKWLALVPSLPESIMVQNNVSIPKGNLTEWFEITIAGVERVERGSSDPGLRAIYWQNIVNAVPQVVGHMNTASQSGAGWLQQTTPQLQAFLWQIRSSLSWLVSAPTEFLEGDRAPRLTELAAQADEIFAVAARISAAEREIAAHTANVKSMLTSSELSADAAANSERTALTSSTNATASATTAEAERQKVDAHVIELEAAVATQQELFSQFEEQRAKVEATLQGASRVALAKSFEVRRASLVVSQYVWAGFFLLGIAGLTGVGLHLGAAVLEESRAAAIPLVAAAASGASAVAEVKMSQSSLVFSLLRFLVLAPVVWFTWFAARQYGHCQRLGEDYAFKSSAAHAFVGYRDEMGDDAEMLKLLREFAIKNFGANPIRVLSRNEPASPLNDIFDKAFEKISPEKFVELLKEAISKVKN